MEDRAAVYRFVRELPDDQRRVIEMRFAEEKGIREIAEAMGRTEGAVKQLQYRAIQSLRERMGDKKWLIEANLKARRVGGARSWSGKDRSTG